MESLENTNQVVRPGFPNLLLISGSGRDAGKTRLVCLMIQKWKSTTSVAAIKISPHHHESDDSMLKVHAGEGYTIWQEKNKSWKDSGKFVEAGADPVFYIEAGDSHLSDAFIQTVALCDKEQLLVCESGGLANYIKPGLLVFIQSGGEIISEKKEHVKSLADLVIKSEEVDLLPDKLKADHGKWMI